MSSISIPSNLDIRNTTKGKGVFTKAKIRKGESAMVFERLVIRPNDLAKITAIQIDIDSYLDTDPVEIRDFLNHSCDPNCKVDVNKMGLLAIRDIMPEEELTFNYCTTEYDAYSKNESFECLCGSMDCMKIVKGFKHLTQEQRNKINDLLVPYLSSCVNDLS